MHHGVQLELLDELHAGVALVVDVNVHQRLRRARLEPRGSDH